jgi:cytochrome c biogenesis protein
MKNFWNFLKSMKTAIVLLIIITIVSALGALIPQNAPETVYLERYGEIFGRVVLGLNINNLYHSWWFLAIILLLAFNITICNFTSFKAFWRAGFGKGKLPSKSNFTESHRLTKEYPELKSEIITKILLKHGFKLKESNDQSFYFSKGAIGRLGAFTLHMGFLVILIGSVVGNQSKISHYQEAEVGDTIIIPLKIESKPASQAISFTIRDKILKMFGKIPPEDFDFYQLIQVDWRKLTDESPLFSVTIDSISATFTPEGQPIEYLTIARVIENDKELKSYRIEVNHPLVYRGYYFYQSNWGKSAESVDSALITMEMGEGDSAQKFDFWIKPNEKYPLYHTGMSLVLEQFVADFVIDEETKEIRSRSNKPANPAIKISLYNQADSLISSQWTFMLHPDFHGRTGDFKFNFNDFASRQYTGLEITKHTGIFFIWLGFTLMILGLLLAFYIIHREVWLYWDKEEKRLYLSGRTNKFKSSLEEELTKIRAELRTGE